MGFWKDVWADVHYGGMSEEKAIEINAKLRYGTKEEKAEAEKLEAIERANRVIDTMP